MQTENLTAVQIAEKIIGGKNLMPDDDLKFLLETPLEELQRGAGLIQKNFAAIILTFARLLTARAGVAAKIVNTAHNLPKIIPALTNIIFCRQKKF